MGAFEFMRSAFRALIGAVCSAAMGVVVGVVWAAVADVVKNDHRGGDRHE